MSVEIIGRAVLAPGADSPEQLFEVLRQRRCMITRVPADRWDQSRYWHPQIGTRGKTYTFAAGIVDDCFKFDAAVFGLSLREAQMMDPQQRMVLHLTWRALESANLDYAALREQRIGVYVGASALDHGNLVVEDPAAASPYFMTGNTLSIVSNRISHVFGLNGPSLTVDTACSSSLVALDLAVKALEAGEVDTAIVGGVNALTHPLPFVGFAQARMLSPEGLCRAYDNEGMGYVRAEGGAVVILRRSDQARSNGDHSFARILATAVNSAGRTNGISLPSEKAQAQLLKSLYERNGIDANRLAFIEGHGTGTKVGDPSEIWSIGTVVGAARRAPIPIGSIKTNIGHTEPASGLMGLMKAMLALENNCFPASLHFETPNEAVDFDALNVHVAAEPIELLRGKHARLAGINSFGFGGTNAHVIISDPEEIRVPRQAEPAGKVFLASAQTASALEALLTDYRDAIRNADPAERRRIIASAGANRPHMKHRFAVAADDPEAIAKALDARVRGRDAQEASEAEALRDQAKIAFVFSGNGSQWAGMGIDAYRRNTAFRDRFNVIHALFQVRSHISLADLLLDPELETKLRDTKIAQPMLFAIQAALADVLGLMGVRPDAVYGHSVGEVAAAYVSGALSLVDAVSVIAKRSYHQDRLAGLGRMAALQLGAEEAQAFFERHGLDHLVVAAVNSKTSITASGPSEQIEALKEKMKAERLVGSVLDINYPFHHPLIEVARKDFLEDMAQIALRPTQIPFISTVTGGILSGTALDPEYWWSNVREPVNFLGGTECALDLGCGLFLEVGPRPILSTYLRETIRERATAAATIPSLLRDESPADPVSAVYSRIIANGGAFDRAKAFGSRDARVVLPPLPFESVEMRHEFTTDSVDLYGRQNTPYTLAGWRVDTSGASWKNHIDAQLFPDLAEHVVDGKAILPGSAFLDIAVSAARQFLTSDRIEISNLEIVRPLDLSPDQTRELSTTISPSTGDIEIRSRDRLSSDDWTLHAMARCRKISSAEPERVAPVKRIAKKLSGSEVYETARKLGLDYGPSFQLLAQAIPVSEGHAEVSLKPPLPTRNPYLEYSLHPVSVDAVFHGLLGVFADTSAEMRDAPYVPVRIGSARIYRIGETVTGARIDTRRASRSSIQADFSFVNESGEVVARFEDCRFRRTYLRQRKPLASVSYHQARVPSSLSLRKPLDRADSKSRSLTFIKSEGQEQGDGSSQMLEAAVFRSCYDIARRLCTGPRLAVAHRLPGDQDFQHFLSNCLNTLVDIGLAEQDETGWALKSDCSLPPVSDILNVIYRERPDRIAEITAINGVYAEALSRLEVRGSAMDSTGTEDTARSGSQGVGETTLEALRASAPAASARAKMVTAGLEEAVGALRHDAPVRTIVELGTVSRSLSESLARTAARHGSRLVIVETRPEAFDELSIAFEHRPEVSVVKPSETRSVGHADIIVSAADHAFSLLSSDADVEPLLGPATRLLLCAPDAGPLADFIHGLMPGWFDRSKDVDFPVGQFANVDDWSALLRTLQVDDGSAVQHQLADGAVVSIEGIAMRRAPRTAAHEVSGGLLVASADVLSKAKADLDRSLIAAVAIGGHSEADRNLISKAVQKLDGDTRLIFIPEQVEGDGSNWLASNVMKLGMIAGLLDGVPENGADEGQRRKQLAILVAKEHAGVASATTDVPPLSHSAASSDGLHAYARVLRNEFPGIEVHWVELTNTAKSDLAERAELALSLISQASGNREWALDAATGDADEVRVVPGPLSNAQLATSSFSAATIRQDVTSQVTSLVWEETSVPSPGLDEVLIEVAAAGLNFRDVMWAMGMLPEEALEDGFAGPTIGMECAGKVVAIGAEVSDLAPGDLVMAVAPAAFSTHVRVKRSGVARLPDGVDPVAGATLPVAFLTAYYALVELGRLREGETVLVHGAAGGVGLAALSVAKSRGAKVIATAGSLEKRRLLETLGADYVFNSRSLDFVDDVLSVTDGAGVDMVLNSLFSEAMERSLSLLKPFGRFLELGKRDFYGDTKIGLRPFRRNISYFGIDADQLLNAQPELSASLLAQLSSMFEKGELTPLPYRAFRADEIVDAFRLMQSSGHIGKIVVVPPAAGVDTVRKAQGPGLKIDADGIHLVLGGIGGFGLGAANWLVDKGAKKVALCSRRGVADEATTAAMKKWAAQGMTAKLYACDITNESAVGAMLDAIRSDGPLKTVVHAAMVLDDRMIENLTEERVSAVVEPKAKGAAIFDRLARSDQLDNFIMFSSATTLVGNPGQANYVAANGYLEGLAKERRRVGLPALAVGFGAISDTGFLTRNADVNEILSKRIGKTGMTAAQALAYVDDYIARDPGDVDAAVVAIADIDMGMARNLKTVSGPLFEIVARSSRGEVSGADGDTIDLAALVAGKAPEAGEKAIFQLVATEIASILRIPASDISPLKVIKDIGLDSLMAMELGMNFRQKTGFEMPLSSVTQSTTVGDVARKLYQKVVERSEPTQQQGVDAMVVDHLAALHANRAQAGAQ
ncbi:SDR family NAD(P)-dependent oxidoreductase [Pseudaminobacter sp. 19-2017]|uniref:SDR family NAD(P)-dependent oxidoreductase n=1 Tax=Pseudaminobacter soli (ex Zhang et al. 2022) TaxID=2831468 RepID=A0A942E1L0_9HYPH|nr:type I polyketide synthase [Pseudaminobacter soli]MBS3649508.1 SDR family NAD(P)-dependent oxidoreductase [Pseudaminobacter soli]